MKKRDPRNAPKRRIVGVRREGPKQFDILECDHYVLVTPSSGVTFRRCEACRVNDQEKRDKKEKAMPEVKFRYAVSDRLLEFIKDEIEAAADELRRREAWTPEANQLARRIEILGPVLRAATSERLDYTRTDRRG